jgi:anaphase-promoting complex subunit 1
MRQAQACMVAGACMALGLRFAGSANQQARTVLTNRLLYFIKRAKTLVGPVRLEPGLQRRALHHH